MFCGACSVEGKIAESGIFKNVICNDINEYLIEMLKAAKNGRIFPDHITEKDYEHIRNNTDEDKALTGFIGILCSFGGKMFGGYARDGKTGRNYAATQKRAIEKEIIPLKDAIFISHDYRDVILTDGCVVFADPPYNNTTGYRIKKFDSIEFWKYARNISKTHLMFICEQDAPSDFVPVWQKPLKRTLDRNVNNRFEIIEKLFIHESNISSVK